MGQVAAAAAATTVAGALGAPPPQQLPPGNMNGHVAQAPGSAPAAASPASDPLTNQLAGMSKQQLYELLAQMKVCLLSEHFLDAYTLHAFPMVQLSSAVPPKPQFMVDQGLARDMLLTMPCT